MLHNTIGGDKISHFFEEGHIAIIQQFLNPDLMLDNPELPNPLPEQTRPKPKNGKEEDPLVKLFRPSESQSLGTFVYVLILLSCAYSCILSTKIDQSDADLCHALVNMVAVVMASPKASNHLWYHMFAPGDLVDTYMTGFMVTCVV